jgi:hypothetical protein
MMKFASVTDWATARAERQIKTPMIIAAMVR